MCLAGLNDGHILCTHFPLHAGGHADPTTAPTQRQHLMVALGGEAGPCVQLQGAGLLRAQPEEAGKEPGTGARHHRGQRGHLQAGSGQRCAEPPATALAQQKLSLPARARGLCWGPSGPRAEAGGGESEPPPHESSGKVPPLPRPAPQPGEPRLSAGYTRASSTPGTAGGAGQVGQGHRRQALANS